MKIFKELLLKQKHKKTLVQEQREILDKFSKVELLMLCDRFIDESNCDKAVEDVIESYPIQPEAVELEAQQALLVETTEEQPPSLEAIEAEELRVETCEEEVIKAVEAVTFEASESSAKDTEEVAKDSVDTSDIEAIILQPFSSQGFVLSDMATGLKENKVVWFEFKLKLGSLREEGSLWSAIRILKEYSIEGLEVIHKVSKKDKTKRMMRVELPLESRSMIERKREELLG